MSLYIISFIYVSLAVVFAVYSRMFYPKINVLIRYIELLIKVSWIWRLYSQEHFQSHLFLLRCS